MFHGKQFDERLRRAAERAGVETTPNQRALLGRFSDWIVSEGVDAGGIGPGETERLVDRHVADSLVFAAAWSDAPSALLDVGAGLGLPGIPLAITHTATRVTLLDRSGTRCRLARRALRVLDLENVIVRQADIRTVTGVWDAVVFRASLPPKDALDVALPLLSENGCAVVGLSRSAEPPVFPSGPEGGKVDLLEIEAGVLDSPAWLLRMTPTDSPRQNGFAF